MVAAGVYMLARTGFLYAAAPAEAMMVIAYIGGITAFMAALMALGQSDIKKIIAYSTLSSLGYMVMSVGVGGTGAGMFYLMTHAFFKALLFLGAGSVIHACHTNDIWEMGKLYPKMKITGVTFILGALAMMGIFPFSGFWSKDEILTATFSSGNYLLFGVGILTAMITAVFMTKVVTVTFFGEKRYHGHPHESPFGMTIPLIVLAVFAVFVGLAGLTGLDPNFGTFVAAVAGSAAAHAGDGAHAEHHFSYFVAITSTIAVFIGIAIGWIIYAKKSVDNNAIGAKFSGFHKALQNRLYIDHFYDRVLVAGIYNNIAKVFNFIEVNIIIHFAINGIAHVTRQVGKGLRLTISGQLQHYAFAMVGGVLVLMVIYVLL
ncbi:MAG: hypothetical protein HYV23_03830 [Deltaproteobacteria bacterium]|nr:hypothetical protein [Deltaproteobacteria bacterium]